ncbi:MAG: hypothetical protein LBP55_03640 [Candidatus Adiutrix sp.]|jgi:hypothetical protein|nr:hypothetical protein [Candidatus Adiutrix sp.]
MNRAWARLIKITALLAAVAGLTSLAACGVKTAPYPEAATLPGQVRGLTQTLTDQGELILSWSPPETNMVGRPLQEIGGFAIDMADNEVTESYCLACPHQYARVDRVPAATPPPGLVLAPGPYTWHRQLREGHVYHFKVYGQAPGGGVHPQAGVETIVWALATPGPLPGFAASMGDKAVELSWSRPAKGFRAEIEKRGQAGDWASLTTLEQSTGHFSDLAVEYEQTYTYRGRLARLQGETARPGPWSQEFTIKVVDVTPPNPPGHLDAALTLDGVRLTWESLFFDPDMAGYIVYRQLSGEPGFTRLNPNLLKENAFFDPVRMQPGVTARYQITAVDKSPRANESLPSPGADVYLDPPAEEVPRPE